MTAAEVEGDGGGTDPSEEIVLALDAASPHPSGDAKVQLLNRVRVALVGAATVDDLLANIVATVLDSLATPPERVRVELVDAAGSAIATAGHDGGPVPRADVPTSGTVRRLVLGERRSLLVADARRAFGAEAGSVQRLRIASLLAAPLVGASGVLGGIFAWHGGDRPPFARGDLELVTALAGLLAYEVETRRLREAVARENADLRLRAAGTDLVVGGDPRTRALLRTAEKAARSDLAVLLVGESGTGKERLAHSIHARSARAGGPFVPVDCGALPTDLVESELFGHVRGAFTGATRDRPGRFLEADGGTLFLDEVGNLPLDVQPKLLRAIESLDVTPVGGDRARLVDLRVVAATNVPLRRLVEEGRFRPDLYYRLAVIEIEVPPLRERAADLPLLVDAFLRDVPGRPRRFDREALDALARYPWPGNLRELRNAVYRAAVMAEGDPIGLADLPAEIREAASKGAGPLPAAAPVLSLAEAERRAIEAALAAAGGNKTRAAALLGISRDTLYRRLGEPPR